MSLQTTPPVQSLKHAKIFGVLAPNRRYFFFFALRFFVAFFAFFAFFAILLPS